MDAPTSICTHSLALTIGSFRDLGLSSITLASDLAKPMASAGNVSVTAFSHNKCNGARTIGNPFKIPVMTRTNSARLQDIRYWMNVFMFLYTLRPCSMLLTIDAKLSSFRMISEACWATSVPVIPAYMHIYMYIQMIIYICILCISAFHEVNACVTAHPLRNNQ
jgi:hypothetical protein